MGPDWFWFCLPLVVLVLRAAPSFISHLLLPQSLHTTLPILIQSIYPVYLASPTYFIHPVHSAHRPIRPVGPSSPSGPSLLSILSILSILSTFSISFVLSILSIRFISFILSVLAILSV